MNNWQVDLFTGLQQADSMQDMLDLSLKSVAPLGFDFCAWRTQLALPLAQRKPLIVGTSEDPVHQKNASGGYDDAPIPKHCSTTIVPAIWTGRHEGELFDQDPELFEEFFGWGHRGGWAQSVMEGHGTFSMFYTDSSTIMERDYLEHEAGARLEWITTAMHSAMTRLKCASPIELTLREKEVLRWCGDGKTADQIAAILSISISTVNFHLRNAMMKLDAPNKTAAVVRAIYMKLLA